MSLERLKKLLSEKTDKFHDCLLIAPLVNSKNYNFWTHEGSKICSVFAERAKISLKDELCDVYVIVSLVPREATISKKFSNSFYILSIAGIRFIPDADKKELNFELDHLWFRKGIEELSLFSTSVIPAMIYDTETECHYDYERFRETPSNVPRFFYLPQPDVLEEDKRIQSLLKTAEEVEVSKLVRLNGNKELVLPVPRHTLVNSKTGRGYVLLHKDVERLLNDANELDGKLSSDDDFVKVRLDDWFELAGRLGAVTDNFIFMCDMYAGMEVENFRLDFSHDSLNNTLLLYAVRNGKNSTSQERLAESE